MRIKMLAAAIAFAIIMTAAAAFAHPPEDLSLTWNKADNTLSVTASHIVNNKTKHYIMSLLVTDGNKQLLLKKYNQQSSDTQFSDKVVLQGVKPGTTLTVELTCNIMGSQLKSITVQ